MTMCVTIMTHAVLITWHFTPYAVLNPTAFYM